jgi:hypothetical protein
MNDCYRIQFEMESPLCFMDRPIFDALIVYCYMKEKYGNVPVNLELDENQLKYFPDLPIEYHPDGYPLSSVMMWETQYPPESNTPFCEDFEFEGSWKKRWCSKHDVLADFGKNLRKVHTGKGAFKSFDVPLPLHNIESVHFYFVGDLERVKYLIDKHLTGIGKKISQGYGFFKTYGVSPGHRQLFEDILLRPVPIKSAIHYRYHETNPHVIKFCGYRPSYYLQENQAKCLYPTF